jgi:hypothetical protein
LVGIYTDPCLEVTCGILSGAIKGGTKIESKGESQKHGERSEDDTGRREPTSASNLQSGRELDPQPKDYSLRKQSEDDLQRRGAISTIKTNRILAITSIIASLALIWQLWRAQAEREEDLRNAAADSIAAALDRRADRLEAQRVADETLSKMQATNDLTLRGLNEAEYRFRQTERPWVGLVGAEGLKEMPKPNTTITTNLTLANSGRSPAIKVEVCGRFLVSPGVPPAPQFKCFGGTQGKTSVTLLVPGAKVYAAPEQRVLSISQVEQIKAGVMKLYTVGTVFYDDPFGGHHWTRFCLFYDPTDRPEMWSRCLQGNDADHAQAPPP